MVYNSLAETLERGQRFAEDRGFRKTGRADRISRLELASANLDGYADIEHVLARKGIAIKTVDQVPVDDEAFMLELYEAVMSMVRDIPRSEENWEPDPYDVWRQNFLKWPGSIREAYFLAMQDGHPVGLANLQRNGEKGLLNGLTGVTPDARHQGVARGLKYRTICWARDNGYEFIDTANDASNAPMLSINIPLGYRALPAREEWLKTY